MEESVDEETRIDVSPPLLPTAAATDTEENSQLHHQKLIIISDLRRMKATLKVSQLLLTVAFGAILLAPDVKNYPEFHHSYTWVPKVGVALLWISVLVMIVGMYAQLKSPSFSVMSQRIGQFICVIGMLFLQGPALVSSLHPCSIWVSSLLVTLVLGATFYVT